MKIGKIILVIILLSGTFFFVYSPHLFYPFPYHIDEWHHISQSIRLGDYGQYFMMFQQEEARRATGMEIGFHFFLFLLSWFINLVLAYQYLPAIWAVISALTLFYVVYKKTQRNFPLALLAIIFFASIKSNVNLTGLWFFTPLSFAIPFIFLYFYLFSEGVEKQNKKLILASLIIMVLLIPTHSVSFLFAVPILLIYLLFNLKFVFKNLVLFLPFLIIPVIGVVFYKYVLDVPWAQLAEHMAKTLQFPYGWGVLELKNSPLEVYSWVGYFFALIGVGAIIITKKLRHYLIYLLWPAVLIVMIIIYRLTGISYLSPYQRNLYYLAISLPFLSAFGCYTFIVLVKKGLHRLALPAAEAKYSPIAINIKIDPRYDKLVQNSVASVLVLIIIILTFFQYYQVPADLNLYQVISQDDYAALNFLATLPPGNVMSTPFVGMAVFPIGHHNVIADVNFVGNRSTIEDFFLLSDCDQRSKIIADQKIKYVISPAPLTCDYKVLYAQNNKIIYQVSDN